MKVEGALLIPLPAPPREVTVVAWFNVDDSFYDHPKVWDAPDCAVSLWARAAPGLHGTSLMVSCRPGCPHASAATPRQLCGSW